MINSLVSVIDTLRQERDGDAFKSKVKKLAVLSLKQSLICLPYKNKTATGSISSMPCTINPIRINAKFLLNRKVLICKLTFLRVFLGLIVFEFKAD